MTYPAPLQQLADRYNELVANFTAGHISQDDALAILASTSVTDGAGAVWAIAAEGHFVRAAYPGATPAPADPAAFVAAGTPLPPSPAFPSPAGFAGDLDTPPVPGPSHGWGAASGPAPVPTSPVPAGPMPGQPVAGGAAPAKSLNAVKEPKERPAVLGTVARFFAANRVFALILLIGALVLSAAFFVPRLSGGGDGTQMPTDSTGQLPGEDVTPTAPAVTADAPSTTDAAAVATALQSGDKTKIQAMIVTPLDDATMLHTQALWAGVAQTGIVVSAQPAAPTEAGKATQVWTLTRDGDPAPAASITVEWVNDNGTWKVTAAPTF